MIDRLIKPFVEDTCEAAFEDANTTLDEAVEFLEGTRDTFPPRFDRDRIEECDASDKNELKDRVVSIFEQEIY